jgi:hypothetical protein
MMWSFERGLGESYDKSYALAASGADKKTRSEFVP